ncbi:GntR family transcriptional regulator [Victivallaceae bacterium BBE-744-WT-12]|uniref:GntR family transcriptional regulator n=1 Tax=Victivallis lenta TaxID=2606640 RepID=A0A844G197_9BACT|nr:substrate-binding domain-containing protein [Victivallis lenta]MST97450.1 GntR family transcriptional regulator [Victivallis lenta]HBP05765.1 hypothetical protein [Lentisphaeria bacterium]HCH84983.1 hypothetical protein [Lentisphaeria bacterium]
METPVYKRLGETIRRRINEGVYPLGSQLPTELEMVNEFNVSRMTVSKGLTELIEAGIIKRIRGKGTFVCSQKFEAIDSKSEIPVIKCILPGAIYEQSFASNALLQGVCAELKNTPYQTGIAFCGNEDEILAELGKAESDNCAGYILWPRESKRFCEAVGKLQAAGFPLILLDSFFPEYQGEFIGTDNFAGAETAVDCLVAHGHRRIGYLTLTPDRSSLAERLAGFIAASTRHCLTFDPRLVEVIPNDPQLPTEKIPAHRSEFLREAFKRMLALPEAERPTALFTSHDFIAIELFRIAAETGVKIPGQLSLIGFDNIDCSGWLPVPLTTVAHDFAGMGRLAARLMVSGFGRNRELPPLPEGTAPRYRVRPTLIERKSVRTLSQP